MQAFGFSARGSGLRLWPGTAFEDGAEEGLEAVAIGSRAEVAATVDDRLRQRGVRTARIEGGELRGVAEKGVRDAFVLLRFARTGGVDESSAGLDDLGRVTEHAQLGGGERAPVPVRCRRHLMSGSRRSVPSPEQGTSTITVSNSARKGSAESRSAWTISALAAPVVFTVRLSRLIRRSRTSHATTRPSSSSAAAMAVALPPGDAQVSSTRRPGCAPARSATSCDASSCTTNQPSSLPDPRSGCPDSTMSASGAYRPAATAMSSDASRTRRSSGVMRRRFARSVSGAGLLLNCIQRSAAANPSRSYHRSASQRGWESVTLK